MDDNVNVKSSMTLFIFLKHLSKYVNFTSEKTFSSDVT